VPAKRKTLSGPSGKAQSSNIDKAYNLRALGEFPKAIGLADLLINEASRDQRLRIELLCLKSECQLRMALFAEALSSALAALHDARELDSQEWIGRALFRLGAVYAGLQMFDLSIKHTEEAAEIHRRCEDKRSYVSSLVGLSAVRIHFEDFEQSRRDATKAVKMAAQLGMTSELIKARCYTAESSIQLGELRLAIKNGHEAEKLAIAFEDHFLLAKTVYVLGKCYFRNRSFSEAEHYFVLAAERFRELHDKGSLKSSLEWLARVYEARNEFKEAAQLYKQVIVLERELLVEHRQSIRIQLTENHETFATRLLHKAPILTTTEIKVCELLLKFFSNKEIAKLLGISVLTVERHRFNIRKKLGLRSGSSLTVALLNT
jgi:tetratricopeptide (TPR) repeat protein